MAGLHGSLTDALSSARIFARGPKAKGALVAHGLTPEWVAESETTAEITEHLLALGVDGASVAVQHHGNGSDGLDEALTAAGARASPLVVYRWGPAPDPAAVTASTQRSSGVPMTAAAMKGPTNDPSRLAPPRVERARAR